MVQSLKSKEIDVGIGLTEGWVAGLGKEASASDYPYRIVGTYVETPLCWAISSGAERADVKSIPDLKGKKIGVSRIGSGSYVMGFVLADQNGWLDTSASGKPPFEVVVLNDFKRLRDGVNHGEADFFMWEHFTSKRYYDNGEIKRVGEIYTPWSSWKIVAAPSASQQQLEQMFTAINKGIEHFEGNKDEAVEYISTQLDYSKEDATSWLDTVRFPKDVKGVDEGVIEKTVDILSKAGVLDKSKAKVKDMVAMSR
jgi:ABC-type nitrate/sulfonate/bicarbonate transport system substrate-binding protein